jgi:PAS domain S-box-containing protein
MATLDHTSPRSRTARKPCPAAGFFQALVENSPDTIFLVDLKTEECMYVSPSVRSLLGREPEAMIGRPLTDFVHPDDASEVLARSAARRQGRGVRTAVTRMSHAGRAWVWVQATASPVIELEGRTTAVFTVMGAAERVRAELGLRSARLRLRRVLDRVGGDGGVFLETRDGTYDLTVEALAAALELRDDETGQHARRVTDFALALTRAIDPELAAESELRYGFLLHDIGKIGVPDAILLKSRPLTEREALVLQMHTTLGEHLLAFVPFVSDLAHDVVAFHHERWDGCGYPWGLRGEAIPLAARIFAVADAFDAITNDRPYRKAWPVAAAVAEIERGAGSQFDPAVVSAFVPLACQFGINVTPARWRGEDAPTRHRPRR